MQQLGCDFLLCSAYKFYGPHVGLLYSRPGLLDRLNTDRLRTTLQTAPNKIETGTLNHAAIAGVTAAIEFIASLGSGRLRPTFSDGHEATPDRQAKREKLIEAYRQIGQHERQLASQLYNGLSKIPGIAVAGQDFSPSLRAPTVSFTFEGKTATEVCRYLNQKNIFAWDGHFYALRAMEMLGLLERGGVTRIGMAVYNTPEEVERTLTEVGKL